MAVHSYDVEPCRDGAAAARSDRPADEPSDPALEAVVHEPHITVVGNVGAPPRTRVLPSGAVVTDFRVASTPRKHDKVTDAWSDGETIWFGVTCWRGLAENVAASLQKGDRVVVTGRLGASSWTTDQGEKRSGLEIDAATVGFDLLRAKAVQERTVPLTVTSDAGRPGVDEHDGAEMSYAGFLGGSGETSAAA